VRAALLGSAAVALSLVLVAHPPSALLASAFGRGEPGPPVALGREALGASGRVRLQVRAPGELFDFPLERAGDETLRYQWVAATDSGAVSMDTALTGSTVAAPVRAGFYHLALLGDGGRTILDSLLVGVLVPFSAKFGSSLHGYRIGTYRWEREPGDATPPPQGFLEVWPDHENLAVSAHLRVSDFLTHDDQARWPRYVALDTRILDKVELVLAYLGAPYRTMPLDVHSGFRTPLHNRHVPRAASDSRHQYGDAVDLALDADGDGRVSYLDVLAVARAVEAVERQHPALTGGLGIYGNRGTAAYVHIDVRGQAMRWRG